MSSGGRIGTWSYWAPEQLNKQPYDFAVDMWSLGVLLYILLVGFHPFDPDGDGNEQSILRNMKAGAISFDDEEWDRVSPKVNAAEGSSSCRRRRAARSTDRCWRRARRAAT